MIRHRITTLAAVAALIALMAACGTDDRDEPAIKPSPAPNGSASPEGHEAGTWCASHPKSQWCDGTPAEEITEPPPSGPEIDDTMHDVWVEMCLGNPKNTLEDCGR